MKAASESWDLWRKSVYVIADPRGNPLYIGRATGKGNPGFGNRYWGQTGAMAAWGHGTRNQLYIGRFADNRDRSLYKRLEIELIAQESAATGGKSPPYNRQFKKRSPGDLRLRPLGQSPKFARLL